LEERQGGRLGPNVVYLFIGVGISKLALLVVLALLAHYLGAAEFGRLAFALAAALLFEAVNDLGLSSAIVRDAAGRPDRVRDDIVAVAPVKVLLSAITVGLAVLVASAAGAAPDLVEITFWLALTHAIIGLTGLPRATFEALERMEFEALSVALEGVVRLAFVLYAFASGFGVLGIAKAYAVAAFVVLIASVVVVLRRYLWPLRLTGDVARALRLLSTGIPFAAFTLLQTATLRFDTLVLGAFYDEAVVGWFAGGARLLESAAVLPGLIATALLPAVARHRRDAPALARSLLVSSQKILVLAGGLISVLTLIAADRRHRAGTEVHRRRSCAAGPRALARTVLRATGARPLPVRLWSDGHPTDDAGRRARCQCHRACHPRSRGGRARCRDGDLDR
jgi:O-antigen/teichoic acid export membrane protein